MVPKLDELAGKYPVIMLAGLPGTGKSTNARKLEENLEFYRLISLLGVRRDLGREFYDESKVKEDLTEFLKEFIISCEFGQSCILDSTFTTPKARQPFYDEATEYKKDVLVIEFMCSEVEAKRRIISRPEEVGVINESRDPAVYNRLAQRYVPIESDLNDIRNKHVSLIRFDTEQQKLDYIRVSERVKPTLERVVYILLK